jgi:predicted site-specific integrase-resolvase
MRDDIFPNTARQAFLNRQDAAAFLKISPSTLAKWRSLGTADAPPMRKHGGRAVYAESDLKEWSDKRKV